MKGCGFIITQCKATVIKLLVSQAEPICKLGRGEALLNIYLINKGVAMGVVVGVATVFALIRTFV